MVTSKSSRNKSNPIKVFIGSSSEAYAFAYTLSKCFTDKNIQPVLWNSYFDTKPSQTFIQILKKATLDCQFAIFILSRDDQIVFRGDNKFATRSNVWFEAGLFMGQHDSSNVFFIFSEHDWVSIEFISDLKGFNVSSFKLEKNITDTLRNISRDKGLNFKKKDFPIFFNELKSSLLNALKRIKLFERIKKIHSETKQTIKDASILLDSDTCFSEGIRLIKSANHSLLTSISFTGSLEGKDNPQWKKIEKELKLKAKKGGTNFIFQRLMNLNDPEIKKQFVRLLKYFKIEEKVFKKNSQRVKLDHTFCEFLEVIISDDEALFVFPDITKSSDDKNPTVGFGILFKKPEAFKYLNEWYNHLLPKKIDLKTPNYKAYDFPYDIAK